MTTLKETIVKPATETTFWYSWRGGIWELLGRDHNNDPIMQNIKSGELVCISPRALNRTWHQRYRSLCCDRWLQYDPSGLSGECFHSGPRYGEGFTE